MFLPTSMESANGALNGIANTSLFTERKDGVVTNTIYLAFALEDIVNFRELVIRVSYQR
jgi:hypothetical protein